MTVAASLHVARGLKILSKYLTLFGIGVGSFQGWVRRTKNGVTGVTVGTTHTNMNTGTDIRT